METAYWAQPIGPIVSLWITCRCESFRELRIAYGPPLKGETGRARTCMYARAKQTTYFFRAAQTQNYCLAIITCGRLCDIDNQTTFYIRQMLMKPVAVL